MSVVTQPPPTPVAADEVLREAREVLTLWGVMIRPAVWDLTLDWVEDARNSIPVWPALVCEVYLRMLAEDISESLGRR